MNPLAYYNALKFRFNRYPSHLVLFVTARCNARCKHCFYWQEIRDAKQSDELTLEEIRKISEKAGLVKFLSITGGEPALRDDVPEIIAAFCKNNLTDHVTLHTNGYYSEKIREIAIRVAGENPRVELNVAVSLDAPTGKHDLIRGVPGIFARAIATIDLLSAEKSRYANINVTVNSCFNCYNQDDIRELSELLLANHAIDGFYLSYARGTTFDGAAKDFKVEKYLEEVQRLNRKGVIERYYDNYPLASLRRTLDFVAPQVVAETVKAGKMIYPCKAGSTVIVISETGEVKPCEMLPESFGNLRENDYNLGKMLFSPRGTAIKKFIAGKGCCCTWECAVMNNLVFNWRAYPRLLKTWFILEFKKRFGR